MENSFIVRFKGKDYPIKDIFARQEATIVKNVRKMQTGDEEVMVDAAVVIINILTGIDIGDLNGTHLNELMILSTDVTEKWKAKNTAPGEVGNESAPQ